MTDSDSPIVSAGDDGALFTVDLSGAPESGGAAFGRIVGGALLMIVGILVALGCLVVYFVGTFMPFVSDWADLLGEAALFIAAIAFGLAIVGFTLMHRSRKSRAAALQNVASVLEATGLADVETRQEPPSRPAAGTPTTLI
jgi:hypothetical protein